ncbi:hypothetical protein FRC12_013083, partial [Ceratobasidium sp. 428]
MVIGSLNSFALGCLVPAILIPKSCLLRPKANKAERKSTVRMMPIIPLYGDWLVWAITACCCQGFLLLGYDQGVMSGIVGAENQFGKDFDSPSPTAQGTIVAIYDIGCAVGSLICFAFGQKLGRRRMIMLGATTMLVGTAILTSSTTRAQLIVGRVVTGI